MNLYVSYYICIHLDSASDGVNNYKDITAMMFASIGLYKLIRLIRYELEH
jgi:hypothetical protein